MRQRLWHSGLMLLACAALGSIAFGQVTEPPDKSPPPAESARAESKPPADAGGEDALPGEVLPRVYHVRDAEGNLQAVPGITYEQLMRQFKQEHQLAEEAEPPPFSIQSLVLTGTASPTTAELVAKYTIAVHAAGWVGVPLRLNGAVRREAPAYAGPGDHILDFEPDRRGHVVWIRGQADQTHEVTLRLAVAVEQVGPQSRLKISVPRAARSELQLQVPLARAVAQVSEGTTLDSVRPLAGGKTELRLIGLADEVELSWHPADSPVASLPTILDVTGEQVIHMKGRSVSTEARLTVRSLGSEFDHFQVRLPPGADYIGPAEPGISLVAVDPAAATGKLYEVRLDQKTSGPKEIRLVTERAHNAAQSDEMLQLAGFEVPGAVQQGGRIVVEVEDNWQIVWGEASNVRPVDDVGGDVPRDNPAGGFEYFQPYTLAARVVPQRTRVRVEPEYVLLIGSEEARLQGRLKYTIRGAKVRSLALELPGWEVDSVGPANLVNVDAEIAVTGDSLMIPLLQATSGELELTIEAHRKINAVDNVSLDLPRPQGDVVAADVAVVSDDNIELVPRPDESIALAPQTVRPQIKLPERQQDPIYYRTTGSSARFAAAVRVHEQSISTAVTTRVEMGQDDAKIDQRMVFQVAYQPTDHLTLIVPPGIRPDALAVMHDGQRIEPVPMRARAAGDAEATPVRINLPQPTIGRCELQIGYASRHETPPAQATARFAVPLVMPGEGQLTTNELYVAPRGGIAVTYPPGEWTEATADGSQARDGAGLSLSARKAIPQVVLAVSSKQSPREDSAVIERGWIETRLTDSGRYDWVVFRLTTSQPRVQLRLPEGVDLRSLVLAVDGARVAPESIRQRDLTIPLADGPSGERILEIGYRFVEGHRLGSMTLEAPQLNAPNWVGQFYWQLVLPEYEHVVFTPPHYDEESRWVWADFYWQHQPTLEQRDLENWIRAESSADTPRLFRETQSAARGAAGMVSTTNRYLFSTVGTIAPLEISTHARARLVLYASLPLLVCGLVLIYFPATRHPAVLFVLAVLVGAASFLAPRSALVLAQASTLGLALVGVAALLSRMLPRRPTTIIPVRGSSQAVRERTVTELYHRAPPSPSPPSTATDPLVPTAGEVES
jgi:hypothetical protein